jgi:hypothetical protein
LSRQEVAIGRYPAVRAQAPHESLTAVCTQVAALLASFLGYSSLLFLFGFVFVNVH